jgi:hypothetical protein
MECINGRRLARIARFHKVQTSNEREIQDRKIRTGSFTFYGLPVQPYFRYSHRCPADYAANIVTAADRA